MMFKGEKIIGKPTIALIEIYVAEKGLLCEPQDVYDYWDKKDWLNQKGREIATLENAINVVNSIVVQRATKRLSKELGITKIKDRKRKDREKRRVRKGILNGTLNIDDHISFEKLGIDKKKESIKQEKEKISYDDQLKDNRWMAFRNFIFAVRGCKCEMCGGITTLQVHHPKYRAGRLAWEYTCNEVLVLCKECHKKVHNIQ